MAQKATIRCYDSGYQLKFSALAQNDPTTKAENDGLLFTLFYTKMNQF